MRSLFIPNPFLEKAMSFNVCNERLLASYLVKLISSKYSAISSKAEDNNFVNSNLFSLLKLYFLS